MATVSTSKFLSLNQRDILKAALMTAVGAALGALYNPLIYGQAIDWRKILELGAAAGISYLIKNFFTPTNAIVQIDKETHQQIKDGVADVNIKTK